RTSVALSSYSFSLQPTPPTNTYTISLHDALPICKINEATIPRIPTPYHFVWGAIFLKESTAFACPLLPIVNSANSNGKPRINVKDRKSTRLNSSHVSISYAVFCLKKKKKKTKKKI